MVKKILDLRSGLTKFLELKVFLSKYVDHLETNCCVDWFETQNAGYELLDRNSNGMILIKFKQPKIMY